MRTESIFHATVRRQPGIVKLTDFIEISLLAISAELLILDLGQNRFRLENK